MSQPVSSSRTPPAPWRAGLADLWERTFWPRVAAGLGLGLFALLVSGKHFYNEYRLGRDGVGVTAILPETLPPPPYRAGAYYPMPVRFVHPRTRETIEIARVNVPGAALTQAAGGAAVGFRYLPDDPRVSDFPPHENRPWGGLLVGIVLLMIAATAALGRIGGPEVPTPTPRRVRESDLSGLGPEPGPLPEPLPSGPLPSPLDGVEWERVGDKNFRAPPYLHAGRDPPRRAAPLAGDDPVTQPFLPIDMDLDEVDPPMPAYVAMPATTGLAHAAGEWRMAQSEETFRTPGGGLVDTRFPAAPATPPMPAFRPLGESEPRISAPAPAVGPLRPVALPVFGLGGSGAPETADPAGAPKE